MTVATTEPGDADRQLVAREVERCRAVAARAENDQVRHQYYDGRATLLELASTADAVAFIRNETLQALAGRLTPGEPEAAAGADTPRWLALWDLSYRTRRARQVLNRQRAAVGLPPIVVNVLGYREPD